MAYAVPSDAEIAQIVWSQRKRCFCKRVLPWDNTTGICGRCAQNHTAIVAENYVPEPEPVIFRACVDCGGDTGRLRATRCYVCEKARNNLQRKHRHAAGRRNGN